MKKVIRQSKKDKNNKKYIIKWLTSNPKWVILISSREERRNADGQKNRQADKSGTSTHSTCLRNWNSHSRNQNGNREYPIGFGEENLPYLEKYHSLSVKSI